MYKDDDMTYRVGSYSAPGRSITKRERDSHEILQNFYHLEFYSTKHGESECLVFDDYDKMRKAYQLISKKCRRMGFGIRPMSRTVTSRSGPKFCIWKVKLVKKRKRKNNDDG